MNLSADLFAECTVALTRGAVPVPHPAPGERRRCFRIELERATVPFTLVTNGQRQETRSVRVRDFSPRGINVVLPETLEPGQQFIVHIDRADATTISILCTACHSKPFDEKLFSVGAEFTCVLKDSSSIVPAGTDGANARAAALQRIRDSVLNN